MALFEETPLTSLFVEGMDDDQIWEQLDLRAKRICTTLEHALETGNDEDSDTEEGEGKGLKKAFRNVDGTLEEAGLDDIGFDDDEDFLEDDESSDDDEHESEEGDSEDDPDLGEDTVELHDPSDEEDEGEEDDGHHASMADVLRIKRFPKRKTGGHPELDDGFFDLASFNAETERAEARKVSRGRLGDGSDEDDSDENGSVDLFAPVDGVEGSEQSDPEQDGGTFCFSLFELPHSMCFACHAEAFYKDFFGPLPKAASTKVKGKPTIAPSPKKAGRVRFHEEVRVKNIKAKGKNMPVATMYSEDDEDDDEEGVDGMAFGDGDFGDGDEDGFRENMDVDAGEDSEEDGEGEDESEGEAGQETIERLKDDLFAAEETPQVGQYKHRLPVRLSHTLSTDLSTHEKRMAALRDQISTLESENVGKKDWVLMGEANSRARPQNSLLEEDLEFERVMKAVPVVTEESVQSLEEKIKARILEGHFDDVVRIRPLEDKPFLPSRLLELQDKKSAQSLAQIYEEEYSTAQSGGVSGDDRDGKLKKEHDEIEKLWENICSKLDALCNAHFMPKQVRLVSCSAVSNINTHPAAQSNYFYCFKHFCYNTRVGPSYLEISLFYACSRGGFHATTFRPPRTKRTYANRKTCLAK